MKIRVIWNVLLCRLGIRSVLPRDYVGQISERDNEEALVDISKEKRLFFKADIQFPVLLRSGTYKRLLLAADRLPAGVYLKVHDAYRPIERQAQQWERRLAETQKANPQSSKEELVRLTRMKVAQPTEGYGGHQTGGAVDVSLCDGEGGSLDMGAEVSVHDHLTPTRSKAVRPIGRSNRTKLHKAMTGAGFSNFPAEWWHFSYGDRLWAAYRRKPFACYGYIKPDITRRGTLANGLEDVSQALGLGGQRVYYMHSTNLDPNDFVNRTQRYVGYVNLFHSAQIVAYVPRSIEVPTAKGIVQYLNADLIDYLDSCGLAPKENYVNLNQRPASITFPDVSVAAQLKDNLKNGGLQLELSNSTLVSSYLSSTEAEIASMTGCGLIMDPHDQIKFNSKTRLRQRSVEAGYVVPPGVEIRTQAELVPKVEELAELTRKLGLDPATATYWVKADSQGSGHGLKSVKGLGASQLDLIREHIVKEAIHLHLFDESADGREHENIKYYMPYAIELDVNELSHLELAGNMCVKGCIGSSVTYFGAAMQVTNVGVYIGSEVSPVSRSLEEHAYQAVTPVYLDYMNEGYRGYLALDVMLFRNKKDNNYVGFCIDPNARFSGGTSLLSLLHYCERETSQQLSAISYFNEVRDSENLFEHIKTLIGPNLFVGNGSNFRGIVPVLVNDITKKDGDDGVARRVVQVVVIYDTIEKVWERYNAYKSNIKIDLGVVG